MEVLVQTLLVVVVVVVFAVFVGRLVRVVTVHDYERGLRFSRGRLVGLTGSGSHLSVASFSEIQVLDGRPTALIVEGQEVLTADGVAVKVSLAARYLVSDPVAAILGDSDYQRAIYLMLQLTLRDALAGRTLDEALAGRREIGAAIRGAAAADVASLGIELLAVQVRDLMVPGELKRAYASVLSARKDGEAALERARAETAALRALANAGRMVEDNPGLLQLRVLQQIGGSSGNTVMLGMPDSAAATAAATEAPAVRRARRASSTGPTGPTDPGADRT